MMIPLVHDFSGETVLIFGGGPVGARRARVLGEAARVIVVSPEFAEGSFGGADLVRAAPGPGDIEAWIERVDPALVVAATDDADLNDAVAAAARDADALANRADRAGGDVIVPAVVREDPVVVAVSTRGESPALSGHLRRRIESELDGAGVVAGVTADIREELRERGVPPEARRAALRAAVESDRVWAAARRDPGATREAAREVIEEALDGEG